MSDLTLLVLLTLGAYRVHRFLGLDTLPGIEDARDALKDSLATRGRPGTISDGVRWAAGIGCAWCLGSWSSFVLVAIVWSLRPLPLPGLWFVAVAATVGVVGVGVDNLEEAGE